MKKLKLSELDKQLQESLQENIVSDLIGIGKRAYDDITTDRDNKTHPKLTDKITNKIQNAYLKDFIEDYIADYKTALKNHTITTKIQGFGFTPERIEKLKPNVQRAIKSGKITDKSQLGKMLSNKFPELWKNTADKNKLLDELMGTVSESYSHYEFLNTLLEGIIMEDEESVAKWTLRWFDAYMGEVDWLENKDDVKKLAREIEINVDDVSKFKNYVSKLAALSWKIVSAQKKIPWGAEDVFNRAAEQNLQPETLTSDDLSRMMQAVKKLDPAIYAKAKKAAINK